MYTGMMTNRLVDKQKGRQAGGQTDGDRLKQSG